MIHFKYLNERILLIPNVNITKKYVKFIKTLSDGSIIEFVICRVKEC
jgi:hypothetical protein